MIPKMPGAVERKPIRVLSLSCVYPTVVEPCRGLFVRSRLQALAGHAQVRVVAPVGLIQWGAGGARCFGAANPSRRIDGGIVVHHPRWLYPPNAGWLNGPLLFLQLLPLLARLRQHFRWEIIDAHYGHPEGVAAALCATAFRCRLVVTVRGSELAHARHRTRRLLLSWCLRRADRVIVLSKELRDLVVQLGVLAERVVLVPNGVDGDLFFPKARDETRERLGLDRRLRIVLSAGRLVAEKGHRYVLDAMRCLMNADPDLRLAVVGGPGREGSAFERELRLQLDAPGWCGRVFVLGEISQVELAEWMNASDLFCLGSLREGFPNVVLEALACGLPVVATRVGATPALLPSEEFGFLVPPGDPVALQDSLRRALAREWNRETISVWGRSRSWRQVGEEVCAIIDVVAAESAAGGKDDTWTSR
jgi:glycosyltransferase involved in cell wall biosynthesis